MITDCVWLGQRLAWINANRILNSFIIQESRRRLVNIARNGFSRTHKHCVKGKQFVENTKIIYALSNPKTFLFIPKCNMDPIIAAGSPEVWGIFQQSMPLDRQRQKEKSFLQMFHSNFRHRCKHSKLDLLVLLNLLFATSVFKWERDGVTDEELLRALSEMEFMKSFVDHALVSEGQQTTAAPDGWELFVDERNLKVWRHFLKEYNQFEYRAYGSFTDISPRAFYDTQMDLGFWCRWEPHTIHINVVDSNLNSKSEVIHWVYRFPYPFYTRDYLYVRRGMVDEEMNKMVIRARAVSHHKCPEIPRVVRVKVYTSQMVITPNTSFDENGFTFYLTYFENPQSQIPGFCYNWLASTGVPGFVDKLREASKAMQERTRKGYRPNVLSSSFPREQKKEKSACDALLL